MELSKYVYFCAQKSILKAGNNKFQDLINVPRTCRRQLNACYFVQIPSQSIWRANVYWAKVLPEQWKLIQISRKHEIFRKNLRMHFEQAIIHLSKSQNFILIKCLQIT